MTDQQDWLKWNAISQDKRQEDLDKIDEEEKTAAALATAREEEARQKEEEQRREENRKWFEEDAERRGVNDPIEIEEEDDPDPWDIPPPVPE
jgi:hypothetical protein